LEDLGLGKSATADPGINSSDLKDEVFTLRHDVSLWFTIAPAV